jgi:hypothetical protein
MYRINHVNSENPVIVSNSSSNQQRVHQRCDALRSSSEYSADAGNLLTTSRSSSFNSSHDFSPALSHLRHLLLTLIIDIYYQTVLV